MSETATATIAATQVAADSYRYSVTLDNTGTTPLGTFWFAWIPGQDYLDTRPTSVADPTGWTDAITNTGTNDGFAIQWHVISTTADELAPGNTLSFAFTSADTPAQVFGDSSHFPGTPVLTAFVYAGEPFSDAGFELHPACFLAGTRILTADGERPVEDLRVGDLLRTHRDGGLAPVQWLGHRRVDCRRHRRPEDVWPVRVQRDAFAPGRPARDLLLSPDHAVFLAGEAGAPDALVPVRYLVNGASVAQEPAAEAVYWHVELPAHDVILAEGLPCESFLDTGNRAAFAGNGPALQLHPDFARQVWQAEACAPLVLDGPPLAAARRRLLARAARLGHRLTDDPGLCVLADGRELRAEADGPLRRVRLPAATQNVRLVSRAWRPAHTRPDETDPRRLGIAIARLWLDGRQVALDSPGLGAGWHAPEAGWRWTDGDAELAVAGAREIAFTLALAGRYWQVPRAA